MAFPSISLTRTPMKTKMNKTIKGKDCTYAKRLSFGIWVAKDGQYVAKAGAAGNPGKQLAILYDYAGPFVLSNDGIRINIAPVILNAFGQPYPGKGYEINWIDGNKHNNDISNLVWEKDVYHHSSSDKEYLYRQDNLIEVHADGTVWCNGQKARVVDCIWDSDVALRWPCYEVFVTLNYQNALYVEDIMADCGYVQGNRYAFDHSVILHRDNDYRNCSSDNLVWVDSTDPRYQAFRQQRLKDRWDVYHRENGNQRPPSHYVVD